MVDTTNVRRQRLELLDAIADSLMLSRKSDSAGASARDGRTPFLRRLSDDPPAGLRVCHIISSFHPVVGGAEKATQSLVKALRQRDLDVIVFTRRYATDQPRVERIDGIPVYRLGWPELGKFGALTFALHALALLAWRFRDWRVVHVQNIDTPLLVGILARSLLRRKLVATIHGHTPILGKSTRLLGRIRVRTMARAVDRFTSINPDNTTALIKIGVPPSRVREVPNGVDVEEFRPPSAAERAAARSELGLTADEFVVVYIGRLVSWKRVDLLIDAWGRLEASERGRLLVVGDGSEAQALRDSGSRVGPDVRLEGLSSRPATYLWAADVFANASGDNLLEGEGLSVALLEAMAVGVPPIVTHGPGNDVVVEDGVTGLSFPVQDVDALENRLRRMGGDADLRRRLGLAARERVRQQYSIEAVAEQVDALYRSLEDDTGR